MIRPAILDDSALAPVLWFPSGGYAGYFRELTDHTLPERFTSKKVVSSPNLKR